MNVNGVGGSKTKKRNIPNNSMNRKQHHCTQFYCSPQSWWDFCGSMIFAEIFTWWPSNYSNITIGQAEWQVLDSGSAVFPDGDPHVIRKISHIINYIWGSNSINDCLAGQDPLNNSFFLHPQKKTTVLEPCSMLNSCTAVRTMSFRQFHEKEVRFPQKLLP